VVIIEAVRCTLVAILAAEPNTRRGTRIGGFGVIGGGAMVTTRRVALTVAAMFAVLVLVVAAAAAEGSDRNDGTANCETCELIANGGGHRTSERFRV
jgi:hypothetical protein